MRKKHDEGRPGEPSAGGADAGSGADSAVAAAVARIDRPRLIDPAQLEDDAALRPRSFDEYVGQQKVVDNLKVFVAAAQRRGEALDHVIFSGPPASARPRSPT